jgi:hypothetical protein
VSNHSHAMGDADGAGIHASPGDNIFSPPLCGLTQA